MISTNRFLYINWKCKTQGLLNTIWSIESALYFCLNENLGRTLIISDSVTLAPSHSPVSSSNIYDLRNYYNFPSSVSLAKNTPVKIYFDKQNKFYKTYYSQKKAGIIYSLSQTRGKLPPIDINAPVEIICSSKIESGEIVSLAQFDHLFYFGWYPFVSPIKLQPNKLLYNVSLNKKAKLIVRKTRRKNKTFCVLHLRRGDMICNSNKQVYWKNIKESSKIKYIKKFLLQNLEKGSIIYIMTNGTSLYLKRLRAALSSCFTIFTKNSFLKLKRLSLTDNYKLFVVELCIAEQADVIISNRNWGNLFQNINVLDLAPRAY